MISTILYIIGVALAILAVFDIFKKRISTAGKIICTILILVTSWIGVLFYYLYARDHIESWFK